MDRLEDSLQAGLLIRMSPVEFISHLRSLVANAPTGQNHATAIAITSQLASHVHCSAIPSYLFAMWLPLAVPHIPHLLKDVLGDQQSSGVRKAGRGLLQQIHWRENWSKNGWEALGGVGKLQELLNTIPLADAHVLVLAISEGSRRSGIAGNTAVDDLVEALTNGSNGVQRFSRMDEIARLVEACSTPFIIKWLLKEPPSSFPPPTLIKSLSTSRPDLVRNIATGAIQVHPTVRSSLLRDLPPILIWSTTPYEPKYTPQGLSLKSKPGTRFCVDLLHSFQDNPVPKEYMSNSDITSFVQITEKHAISHKTPFDDILPLLQLGLTTSSPECKFKLSNPLFKDLLRYWAIATYPDYVPNVSINHKAHPLLALSHPSRPNAKHSAALEELLVATIASIKETLIPARRLCHTIIKYIQFVFEPDFVPAARMPLIKLLCRYVSTVMVDLDNPQLTVKEWQRINLDAIILTKIPNADSKWLFGLLPSSAVAEDLIKFEISGTPWASVESNKPAWFKYGLLEMMWESKDAQSEDDFPKTWKFLEDVKKQTEHSRDADVRMNWAVWAAELAMLSTNVSILKNTIIWAKRYKRDHVVYPGITRRLLGSGMASLLSCVKLLLNRRPASLSALMSLVDEANSVLSLHIETALLYLREPSFQANTFSQLAHLLRNVLTERLDGLKALQRFRLGSEKKLVSILIEPMLPILLLYEETSITEGNEPLCWDNPHGLLQSLRCSWPADQCVLPLLDKLAKCRDKQWEKERLKKNELVATLDEGWPKGLPIQCLLPSEEWMRQALAHPETAPFVAERVEKVVFCDAKEAFTAVPPDTDAIGPFVDSLQIAIQAYVGQKPATSALNRIERVWGHYTHVVPLAAGYVEMVKSILKHIASIAEVDWMKEAVKPRVPPSLPASEMHTADLTPIEWDPRTDSDSSSNITTESKNLGFTANLLLSRFTAMEHVGPAQWRSHTFMMPQNRSLLPRLNQSKRRDSIWEVWNDKIRQLPLANRDALVASAMLYVDAFAAGNSRLLSKPFPVGMRHPRYPAMYLDYEFLSEAAKAGDYIDYAIVALEKLSTIIPALLLQQLANSMLDKLIEMSDKDSVDHILESATFRIIAILSRTDQPHLASSLGLRIIKEMPYSSSWHRTVISARLCNRLSPDDFREMLENFAHFILNFLNIQEESRKTKKLDTLATGEDPTPPTQEYAKVTTIKLLVELLERGDLVSSEVSVDMLRSLFFKSNHIDVKHAALRSVIRLLQKSSKLDVELRSMLYKTLVSFSAAAAGPNERYTASEEEWLAAENCGAPPECSNDRPLLDLFLIEGHRIPYELHEAYVHDVLFTILRESTRQHDRWMRIFLGRINVQPEDVGVTDFGPFDNKFADKLLSKWTNNIPKGFLKRHRALTMRYLYCDNLGDINEKLSAKDPLWKQTNAGEHWIYYLQTHKSYESAFEGLGTIIQMGKISRSYDFGEVTNDDVEDEYCQRVAIAVRNPRYYLGDSPVVSIKPFEFAFGYLLFNNDLTYIFSTSASGVERIRLSRRQPLERIIADVESLHTESWLSSSSRNPPVLPSIWRLQCYLIRALPAAEQLYIDSLAEQCAQSIFITDDFDYLAIAVRSVPPHDQITILLGLGKAAQNDHNTALGCIKVQLAHNIMQRVRNLDKSKRSAEIKSLLGSWLKSSNEFIRKLAFHELERISLSKGEVVSELDL